MDFSILKENNNKNKVAIICVGFNRLEGLKRLIDSLLKANYNIDDVPLIISIDCSGEEDVYNYAKNIIWPFGKKYVNIQKERLGLKEHIFQCGDLSKYFKAVIILEDDLYVSPFFYEYTLEVISAYTDSNLIAGFSLYAPELNGFAGLPFIPLQNGSDVYLSQDVPTWGECFTFSCWMNFKKWYSNYKEDDIKNSNMPDQIKSWERAWSKYFYTYVVRTNKYFIYPYNSYTTNFSDAGEHGLWTNNVQVSLVLEKKRPLLCAPENSLVKYDVYQNNECLYDVLGFSKDELIIDLYANVNVLRNQRYILTTKILNHKVMQSYGLRLRPIELNIIQNIKGDEIYLYDLKTRERNKRQNFYIIVDYYLKGFNKKMLLRYIKNLFVNKFRNKLLKTK